MALIMKKKNKDGVEIIKEVEDCLYTQYIALGWVEVKEKENKPITLSKTEKVQPKEEKLNDKDL